MNTGADGRDRFPADVHEALSAAGWRPGRDVALAVDDWVRRTGVTADLELHPAARAALNEFGGLHLPQQGPNGTPVGGFTSHFYPAEHAPTTPELMEFADLVGRPVFPLGWNDDGPSHLVIDVDGRVFQLHWADDFLVGESLDAALVWMVRGGDLPTVDDHGQA